VDRLWGKEKKCWVCGTKNWSVLPSLFEMREFDGGSLNLSGDLVPLLVLSCVHCGNTVMFSAIKLGIVPPRKEEVPAAAGSYVRVGSEKL
jgi:hypothetical protein